MPTSPGAPSGAGGPGGSIRWIWSGEASRSLREISHDRSNSSRSDHWPCRWFRSPGPGAPVSGQPTRRFNTRVRWSFAPQGEFFLVYNHNLDEERDLLNRRTGWRFGSNQLLTKLQYDLRY